MDTCHLKEHSTLFKIDSFYNSSGVKRLGFTILETIQLISDSGGSTFSLALYKALNQIKPLISILLENVEKNVYNVLI